MTRGTLFYYESDDKVWESTEFNGDMYHGTRANPEGIGDDVIKLMSNLKSLDDFKKVLKEINKHYGYDEGNNVWPVGEEAIEEYIKKNIDWCENERPDLLGGDMDPRTWKKKPTFKDTNTWKFWGTPNLSDYSYIYNNSGKDLVMKTRKKRKMVIPTGYLGVLNYGANDCLCKDGEIVDGMGNYKADEAKSKDTRSKYDGEFEDYEKMEADDLIEEKGKTWGLATFFAVNAVNILENGNWEKLRDFIYEELVNHIDE